MIDFLISVVCYNNENEIIEFAKKLRKQKNTDQIKLVVTCNSCSDFDRLCKEIKKEYPVSEVFNPPKNLGYINGCLYGFLNQKDSYKWGLISNTDIEFASADFFEKILSFQDDSVWCIGPDIVLVENGIHQNPYQIYRFSPNKKKIKDLVFSCYLTYRIYFFMSFIKKIIRKRFVDEKKECVKPSGFVYAVHGSCFILKKDCLDALIAENNQIFMYDEEIFVAEVVLKNHKRCYYDQSLKILHNEHQTTGRINYKTKQKWYKQSIQYLKKFY